MKRIVDIVWKTYLLMRSVPVDGESPALIQIYGAPDGRDVGLKKRMCGCLALCRLHKTDKTDAEHKKNDADHPAHDVAVHGD